jgi:HSP20 family protein
MTIVKTNSHLLNPFPTLFDDFLSRNLFNWQQNNYSKTNTSVPAVNIRETADEYGVEVAAPGMKKEDFKVQLDGNTLTISSEKTSEKNNDDASVLRTSEFSYQSFSRSFTLQNDVVDIDKISAKYEQGVLYLQIPKKEMAKKQEPRLITVS